MKILFACDMDNTLIHSYKHWVQGDICVEVFNGKEQSFISPKTYELLKEVVKHVIFVPITTRSIEQFNRITWEEETKPTYAITTNGAILLEHGEKDEEWGELSQKHALSFVEGFESLREELVKQDRFTKCKLVDNRFLYARFKSEIDIEEHRREYEKYLNAQLHITGRKLYFIPENICKGIALKQLKEKLGAELVFCAGDSTMDLPMFEVGDIAYAPNKELVMNIKESTKEKVVCCEDDKLFAEFILEDILKKLSRKLRGKYEI